MVSRLVTIVLCGIAEGGLIHNDRQVYGEKRLNVT